MVVRLDGTPNEGLAKLRFHKTVKERNTMNGCATRGLKRTDGPGRNSSAGEGKGSDRDLIWDRVLSNEKPARPARVGGCGGGQSVGFRAEKNFKRSPERMPERDSWFIIGKSCSTLSGRAGPSNHRTRAEKE